MSDSASRRGCNAKFRSIKRCFEMVSIEPILFLCIASAVFKFVILSQFALDSVCYRDFNATSCANVTNPKYSALQAEIQSTTAKWMLGLHTFSLSLSLCTVPLLGSFADAFGTKHVLYIPPAMFDLQSITYVILSWKSKQINPAYLFFCIGFGGLSGDTVGVVMLSSSYLASTTTEGKRTFRLVLLDGIISLSMCIFTFISGYVIIALGYTISFASSAGIDTAALIWLFLGVPNDRRKIEQDGSTKCSNQEQVDEIETGNVPADSQNAFSRIRKREESKDFTKASFIEEDDDIDELSERAETSFEDSKPEDEAIVSMREYKDHCIASQLTKEAAKKNRKDEDVNEVNKEDVKCDFDASCDEVAGAKCLEEDTNAMQVDKIPDIVDLRRETLRTKLCNLVAECDPIKRLQQLIAILKEQGDSRTMITMLTALCISTMCVIGESLIPVLYVKNHPFNMSPVNVGYLLSLQGLLLFIAGCVLLNIIVQRFLRMTDIHTIIGSFILSSVYFILLGSANSSKMLFGIQIMGIFCPLVGPTLRSIISKTGSPENYGIILSVAVSIDAVAAIIANIIVHTTYSSLVANAPGAFCYILSALSGLSTIVSFMAKWFDKEIETGNTRLRVQV